jgi:hypothetical protein
MLVKSPKDLKKGKKNKTTNEEKTKKVKKTIHHSSKNACNNKSLLSQECKLDEQVTISAIDTSLAEIELIDNINKISIDELINKLSVLDCTLYLLLGDLDKDLSYIESYIDSGYVSTYKNNKSYICVVDPIKLKELIKQ